MEVNLFKAIIQKKIIGRGNCVYVFTKNIKQIVISERLRELTYSYNKKVFKWDYDNNNSNIRL